MLFAKLQWICTGMAPLAIKGFLEARFKNIMHNTEWSIKIKEVDRELIRNFFSFYGPPNKMRAFFGVAPLKGPKAHPLHMYASTAPIRHAYGKLHI